jgi:hypothetical protein
LVVLANALAGKVLNNPVFKPDAAGLWHPESVPTPRIWLEAPWPFARSKHQNKIKV